jgi:hypothetical protein
VAINLWKWPKKEFSKGIETKKGNHDDSLFKKDVD